MQKGKKEAASGTSTPKSGEMKCDNISGSSLLPDGGNVKGGGVQ